MLQFLSPEGTDLDVNQSLRYDVAIPRLKICIELQGVQHFRDVLALDQVSIQSHRDSTKRLLCEANGWTLIEIPYWWDGQTGSLLNTIRLVRPDAVPQALGDGMPIPNAPPQRPYDGLSRSARRRKKITSVLSDG